jgi:hypothetical protein
MKDTSLEQIEMQLAGMRPQGAPFELRGTVLGDVRRELRAAQWDRRLGGATAVLLIVGTALNLAIGLPTSGPSVNPKPPQLADANPRQSLVDAAVLMAEVTDAATGSLIARNLAMMAGDALTKDEEAEIDSAIERSSALAKSNGSKG